ncbi:MAG: hypothetical protein A2W22_05175 [Candidatus Levybacteria bacterium RBG_16_35_11]|nr:MAG: hypothetical protein A2W22_05175 [Candidatus Levybacteria bacterium RBG_16_35_11]
MKNVFLVIAVSVYIFLLLGFVMHTSANPVIFGKYSLLYFFVLLIIAFCLYPFIKLINFLFYTSKFKVEKRIFKINPLRKILYLFLLFLILLFLSEITLLITGQKLKEEPYTLNLDNFHLFLQSTLNKENNRENPSLHINSFNFRGDEIKKEKDKNTFRIFVLGGSSVLNVGVPYEKSFGKILQEKLKKEYPNKKIEVLNAGMDGYTSEHTIIQYLFNIKDLNPDLLITWQGINDMYYSCSGNFFTKGMYKNDYSHQLGSVAFPIKQYFSDNKYPVSFRFHLVTFDFLRHTFAFNFYSDINPLFNKGIAKKLTELKLSPYHPSEMKNFPSINSYKRNLLTLINVAKNDNVPLILGNQPFLYSMSLDESKIPFQWYMQRNCLNGKNYPDTKSLIYGISLFNKITEDTSLLTETTFIDFEKELPKTNEYFFDDVHPTERGNLKIAEILFVTIAKENYIKAN